MEFRKTSLPRKSHDTYMKMSRAIVEESANEKFIDQSINRRKGRDKRVETK